MQPPDTAADDINLFKTLAATVDGSLLADVMGDADQDDTAMRLGEVENVVSQSLRALPKGEIAIRATATERPRFRIDEEAKAARDRLDDARSEKKAEIVLAGRKREDMIVERKAQARAVEAHHKTSSVDQSRPGIPSVTGASPSAAAVPSAKPLGVVREAPSTGDTSATGSTNEEDKAGSETKAVASTAEADAARANDYVVGHSGQTVPGTDPVAIPEAAGDADQGRNRSGDGSADSDHEPGGEGEPGAQSARENTLSPSAHPGAAPAAPDRAGLIGPVSAGDASTGVDGVGGSAIDRAASVGRSTNLKAEAIEDGKEGKAEDSGEVVAFQSGDAKAADPAGALPTGSNPAPQTPAAALSPGSAPVPHQGLPVPLGAVPMTIGLRSLSGSNHFEIRLDPVDLGRIDVRLEIDKERGTVTTKVVVERPETLALLRRDADNLQQALSQAGLDPGAGISLSLSGDDASRQGASGDRPYDGRHTDGDGRPAAQTSAIQAIDLAAPRMLRGIAGIDIRI